MKTLRVRPVLVESKIPTDLLICGVDGYLHKTEFYGSAMESMFGKDKYQELILISLEDENSETFRDMYETICLPLAIKDVKKVIARQSQISPEYISKFIEQYNNGCVEDLEIEMEYISGWSKLLVEKQGDPIKYHIQPKLTKGFVTIVEKELIHLPIEVKKDSIVIYGAGKFHEERLIINRGQAALLFVELYKFLEFDK